MNRPVLPLPRAGLAGAGLALAAALSGCQLAYVLKQGTTQLDIAWSAVEIESIRQGREVPATFRPEDLKKLDLIAEVKSFAETEIGLAVGDSYSTYYDTGGSADGGGSAPVSYVVTAAHPLALIPYQWSFPFVGRVAYKGFFEREDALEEKRRLDEAGWDTWISEVSAYSTLGWFRDPVLSSMLQESDADLAELILHELVHRTVYIKGHTALNESLATVVARAAATEFLLLRRGGGGAELAEYRAGNVSKDLWCRALLRLRSDLDSLYRSRLDDAEKRRRKLELFETATRALARLFPEAPGRAFPPSNAHVIGASQYLEHIPLFERLLGRFRGSPRELMAFLKSLPVREDPLSALVAAAGAAAPGQE
jgi:predicted aminopeptidase